jgi:hypothetical protein
MSECRDCTLGVCSVHLKGAGWTPEPVQIKGSSLRVTRLDAEGQVIGPPQEVPLKRMTMEMTMQDVDPGLLALLTGSTMEDGGPPPMQSMTITGEHPAKRRTLWEWLRRRPKHEPVPYSYHYPNVKIGPLTDEGWTITPVSRNEEGSA